MFKINAEPTFDASLTIIGQGREQTLKVVFRHMDGDKYGELLKAISEGKTTVEDAILKLVESWDADAPLSKASLKRLQKQQPGCDWAIVTGYSQALAVARKGN